MRQASGAAVHLLDTVRFVAGPPASAQQASNLVSHIIFGIFVFPFPLNLYNTECHIFCFYSSLFLFGKITEYQSMPNRSLSQ
jgi:hypothetical protein